MKYIYSQKVLFQHCDPARIVFYPRYFEMLNACVESWFEEKLDCSFADMHGVLNKGIPTVTISAEFHSPSYLGDILEFELNVTAMGRSSLDIKVKVTCESEVRVNFNQRIVFIDSESGRSCAWPESLVTPLKIYLTENA